MRTMQQKTFSELLRSATTATAGAALAAMLAAGALGGCGSADGTTADGVNGDDGAGETLAWTAPPATISQDLKERIERADQILHGEVIGLQYATSEDLGAESLSFPHTFVTLSVLTPIKGGAAGDEVTLRFGGGDGGDGTFTLVSDNPLFDLGDEVVLFAQDNGRSICPLVDCEAGVVRVSGGEAFDAHGNELFTDDEGALRAGHRRELPELDGFTLGEHTVWVDSPTPPADRRMDVPGAMAGDELVDLLTRRVRDVHSITDLAALPSVASEDPSVPFVIPHPGTARPAFAPPKDRSAPELTDEDREELAALAANDFNPVLPPR